MITRTNSGNLQIEDTFFSDKKIVIIPAASTIELLILSRSSGSRVYIALGPAELDALAAEILRIREERGI